MTWHAVEIFVGFFCYALFDAFAPNNVARPKKNRPAPVAGKMSITSIERGEIRRVIHRHDLAQMGANRPAGNAEEIHA
jgi:hypothetical protein